MTGAFHAGSIEAQFNFDAAIDVVTLRFSTRVASEDGGCSPKREDVVDTSADLEVVEL